MLLERDGLYGGRQRVGLVDKGDGPIVSAVDDLLDALVQDASDRG